MSSSVAVLSLLAAALLGLWAGDCRWVEDRAPAYPFFGLVIAAALVVLLITLRHRRGTALAALGGTALAFACSSAALTGPPEPSPSAQSGTEALWRVQVVATPAQVHPASPKRGAHTTVALRAQQRHALWCPEDGRAEITLWEGPEVARGDVILVRLVVRPLRDAAPPWGDSRARLMRRRGVSAQALVCGPHALEERSTTLWALSDHARQRAAARLQRLLPAHLAGIAQALALGDTQGIALEQRDAWGDAGTAHLLAVSGLHVGLVARAAMACVWALLAACPPLAERFSLRRAASLSALPFVWGYALFTGGSVSALRAAVMLTFVLTGYAMGRGSSSSAHGLGAAGLLLLALDPLAASSASFWLSFVSVACLLGGPFMPWNRERFEAQEEDPPSGWRRLWGRWGAGLASALTTGAVAAIGTAPLCALFFGRLSVVAPFTNLIAVPLGGAVATPLALASTLLSAWLSEHHVLVRACAWACGVALGSLDTLARYACALPWAALQQSDATRAVTAAACLALGLVWGAGLLRDHGLLPPWPRTTFGGWAAGAAACAALACAVAAHPWGPTYAPGVLTLWHLDVAQGDSTLIGLPHGGWVLVDGGGASYAGQSDPGRWAVAQALRALGVSRLRAVVLTHPHPDHMGGLAHVLQRWPTDVFWRTDEAHQVPHVQALEAAVRRGGGRVELPPPTLQWGAVGVRAFMPLLGQQASVNDHSIVLELTYGARRVLLMGDAERAAERQLLPDLVAVDVVKVGHHGSRTSSSSAFLRAARPALAVISCGPQNRFGHPHEVTLQALEAAGARVLRTDVLGTVCLRTDGTQPFVWAARSTAWQPRLQ